MNNKAFIMPVVLAFILICSSTILYQSMMTINQLLAVRASINQLTITEYATNTSRIINEQTNDNFCEYEQLLNYKINNHNYSINRNCIYTNTDLELYNQIINELIHTNEIKYKELVQFKKYIQNGTSEINNNIVNIKNDNLDVKTTYDQKLFIYIVNFNYDPVEMKIILTDVNKNIMQNKNVIFL